MVGMLLLPLLAVAEEPAVVRVLGTVHFPTPSVDADAVLAEIEAFDPDVLLMEIDHTVFAEDYSLTAAFDENEWNAARTWLASHPELQLRPYDRDERNATRARLGLQSMGRALWLIEKQARRGRLDPEGQAAVERFQALSAELRAIGQAPLSDINTPETDALVRERQHLQYVVLTGIVERHEVFGRRRVRDSNGQRRSVRELWSAYAAFETEREAEMVAHIAEWAEAFPGQRVLVFAGFYHRPSLLSGLEGAEEDGVLTLSSLPE